LNQIRAVKDYVVEAYTGDLGTDELRLYIQTDEGLTHSVDEELRNAFQSRLRVVPLFKFISNTEMEKLQMDGKSRKIKKFIDHRK
jgi:phenylacetate-CoA ligase